MLDGFGLGVFFAEVKTGCLGVVIVGFSVVVFFYLNHDKVKLEFIMKVISDIAICKVLYA